jgi:hypothetical protein
MGSNALKGKAKALVMATGPQVYIGFVFLFLHFTNSNHTTDTNPTTMLIPSCGKFSCSNSKNLVKGFMYSKSAVNKMVTPMISGTRLFLYFIVALIE